MSLLPQILRRTLHCASQGTLTLTDLGESGAIMMLSERDQMLTINPSAAFLLRQLLAMPEPIEEAQAHALSQQLADRFAIPSEQAHQDTTAFFEQLEKWL